jgi:hypothetical protein
MSGKSSSGGGDTGSKTARFDPAGGAIGHCRAVRGMSKILSTIIATSSSEQHGKRSSPDPFGARQPSI